MQYSQEVEQMVCVAKGPNHGPAPIPEEGKWIQAKEITDISGFTHGVGWCAPQQGACKLTLNVKDGIIEEALVETLGCSGMTHSAAMAARDPARQDHAGGAEHRPGVRRHQHRHARAVPADRLRPHARPRSPKAACPSAPAWRTWARACALRWAPCSAPRPRACAIWKWPRAMCSSWLWTRTTRSSATSSCTWAR